jgi:uncharacterized protein
MLFLYLFFIAYYLAHVFVWWRVTVQLRLSAPLRRTGYVLALLPSLGPILAHLLPLTWPIWVLWAAFQTAFLWFGLLFYALLFQLGALLLEPAVRHLGRSWTMRSGAGFAACMVLTLAVGLYGIFEASRPPLITSYTLDSPKIQGGLRIVQVSDLHLGVQVTPGRIRDLVRTLKALRPDLLLYTGDLLSDSIPLLEEHSRLLSSVQPTMGAFGVMGNHEFYVGTQESEEFFERTGITLLRNELHHLPELNVTLAGVDDPAYEPRRDGPSYVADRLDRLMDGIDRDRFLILLFHRPWGWPEAVIPRGFDLQLSGHTHGGQIYPFHLIVKLFDPFLSGRFDRSGSTLVVTTGTGTWGPPMRVFAPTEIVVVDVTGDDPGAAGASAEAGPIESVN